MSCLAVNLDGLYLVPLRFKALHLCLSELVELADELSLLNF